MNTEGGRWIERVITLVLIVLSSFSGYFIDKTQMEDRMTVVEKLSVSNKEKLDKANLELILYRMDQMDATVDGLVETVDELDEKIDESTITIINRINDMRK